MDPLCIALGQNKFPGHSVLKVLSHCMNLGALFAGTVGLECDPVFPRML